MHQRFERLVREYQNRIYTYAAYYLGNNEEAQDVTQNVLLKLWRNLEDIEPSGIWPWLVRVTRNASIDAIRKRGSYRNVVGADPEGTITARRPSSEPSPHAQAETADFSRHLRRALEQLSEPYRSIVILREVQDLKYEEISAALDLPLNTVKVYLHRGRKKLREELREFVDHDSA